MKTFLDVFAGAGGLSLGLTQAGWFQVGSVESWPDAVKTHRQNFQRQPVFNGDITQISADTVLHSCLERPQWIVGGPPCQGFSTVGRRDRTDPRNILVEHFARIVAELNPEGFIIENVLGLRDMRFITRVQELFSPIGYRVSPVILTAAEYGVPQLRRRIFFIGDSRGLGFVKPHPMYQPNEFVSVWDAIGDLPPLQPGECKTVYEVEASTDYQEKLRASSEEISSHHASRHPKYLVEAISHIPDGGNRRSIPENLQPASGYHNSYSRLHSASPAVAVTQNMGKPSGTRCIHPFQNRGLTAREGARLQGFPDSFQFVGGMISQRLQVANAVPPLLARAVGTAVLTDDNWVASPEKAEARNKTHAELDAATPKEAGTPTSSEYLAAE